MVAYALAHVTWSTLDLYGVFDSSIRLLSPSCLINLALFPNKILGSQTIAIT